jgi:hypothetical protein
VKYFTKLTPGYSENPEKRNEPFLVSNVQVFCRRRLGLHWLFNRGSAIDWQKIAWMVRVQRRM